MIDPSLPERDTLEELLAIAQPIGPSDLAENFDHYTGRAITDDPPQVPN